MTRALLWKELREQRQLVLAAWLIAAVLPLFLFVGMLGTTPDYELAALGKMLPLVVVFFVWPVFGAATGATSVAADMSDDSLRFLFSRPVSRSRVWFAKVVAAAAALTLAIVGSTAIALLFDFLVTGRVRLFGGQDSGPIVAFLVLAGALFIAAHYCSLFVHRPLTAALAGTVLVASVAGFVGGTWSLLLRAPSRGALTFFFAIGSVAAVPLAMIGLLGAAWWVFSRGDLFSGNAVRRMAVPLAVVMSAVSLLGAVPGAYFSAYDTVSVVAGMPEAARVIDGSTVLVQPTATGIGTRIANLDLETGTVRLIGARNAAGVTQSPDGSLLAYVRFPGPIGGLVGSLGELRVVRSDGSEDRLVASDLALRIHRNSILSISPDNRFVVASLGRNLILLAGLTPGSAAARHVRFQASTRGAWSFNLLGWTADPPHELLYRRALGRNLRPGHPDARTEIVALDPATGTERVVTTIPGYRAPGYPRDPFASEERVSGFYAVGVSWTDGHVTTNRAWRWFPMFADETAGAGLSLLDTTTGERLEVSREPCKAWGFDGASRFIYGICTGKRLEQRMELRVRDLAARTDELFAVVDGFQEIDQGRELFLSPDGSRLVAFLQHGRRPPATYVIERNGVRAGLLSSIHTPLGWVDDDHVALVSFSARWSRSFDIGVVDVETGTLRPVYSQ